MNYSNLANAICTWIHIRYNSQFLVGKFRYSLFEISSFLLSNYAGVNCVVRGRHFLLPFSTSHSFFLLPPCLFLSQPWADLASCINSSPSMQWDNEKSHFECSSRTAKNEIRKIRIQPRKLAPNMEIIANSLKEWGNRGIGEFTAVRKCECAREQLYQPISQCITFTAIQGN